MDIETMRMAIAKAQGKHQTMGLPYGQYMFATMMIPTAASRGCSGLVAVVPVAVARTMMEPHAGHRREQGLVVTWASIRIMLVRIQEISE